MYLLLAYISGSIVTIMLIFNNQLSYYYGVYLSTVIIHFIGLITFIIIMIIKRKKISIQKRLPLWCYTGGAIGVLTVILNMLSMSLDTTLISALAIIGQLFMSFILEKKGWLFTQKKPLSQKQILSLIIMIIGMGMMLL